MKYITPEIVLVISAVGGIKTATMHKLGSIFTDNQQSVVPPTNYASSPAYEADE